MWVYNKCCSLSQLLYELWLLDTLQKIWKHNKVNKNMNYIDWAEVEGESEIDDEAVMQMCRTIRNQSIW